MLTRTTLWVTKEELADIQRKAMEDDISMSQLIRRSLRQTKVITSARQSKQS